MGLFSQEKIKRLWMFQNIQGNGWKWNLKIKTLRSDNGGEFTSNEFWNYCEEHGIKRKFLAARTPQQNGVVERRKKKTIEEMARTMLNDSKLSDIFLV